MKILTLLLFAVVLISCSPTPRFTAEDILNSSDYWVPSPGGSFSDGGSYAVGLINENGDVIYLWAEQVAFSGADKQTLYLKKNYNDPHGVVIPENSELEKRVLYVLEHLDIPSSLKFFVPTIETFKKVLQDRTKIIGILPDEEFEQEH
jgi:hypothetical protein